MERYDLARVLVFILAVAEVARVAESSDKPKIVTSDGHLKIQSAANHNISLEAGTGGDVLIGKASLKRVLSDIKALQDDVKKLKQQISSGGICGQDSVASKCGSHGVCVPASAASSNGTGYRCVCEAGWQGPTCAKKVSVNACRNVLCSNGGTCTEDYGVAICKCASGFFGPRCNLQLPSSCSRVLTDDQGTISSPGYPNAYPPSANCTYRIRTSPGTYVVVSFLGISIENSPGCSKDYIEVRDGASSSSPLLKRLCGSPSPSVIMSTGNDMYIRFVSSSNHQVGAGFSLYYYNKKSDICGGTLTSDSGTITSPNWPSAYSRRATCTWLVKLPRTERISYQVTQLVVVGQPAKCRSYLELHDGPSEASPIIGKFCSQSVMANAVTTSNNLFVKFVTDGSGSLFRLGYTTPCGGNLTSPSGTIQSPYFPNNYPHKKSCTWTITVPRGNAITLRFPVFDIEPSTNCIYDYIAAYNGPSRTSPYMGRFCGSNPPTAITSSMNELTLVFNTDGSDSFRGFRATYTSAPGGCGGAITGRRGNFSTPTDSSNYPHSTRCIWTITSADRSRSVQLYFLTFNLERDSRCRYDYVTFRDGALLTSPVMYNTTNSGRFCGVIKPPVVTSTGESLTVTFISDSTIAGDGFSAEWVTVPKTSGCDRYLVSPTGSVMSPNYPNNYPHSANCKYTIAIASGLQIALVFQNFALERHDLCRYDSLTIFDGANNTSPQIGKFCGTSSPGRIVSTGNMLHLQFTSDFSGSAKGFFANYTTGSALCGGMLHAPSGFIRSPNYPQPYRHRAACVWVISVPIGNTISITVTDLDIEAHSGCRYDYVLIRDGYNNSAAPISRLCGANRPGRVIKSTGNFLYVSFVSDATINGRGFEFRYTSGCGGVYTDLKGFIVSPNYPSNYPNNRVCNYTIRGAGGDVVRVNFTDFITESSATCRHDYVSIHNGSSLSAPMIGKYCGIQSPFSVVSTVSSLFMMFKSDISLTYRGFNASYEIIGCSKVYTAASGTVMSPNYPNNYPNSRVCKSKIRVANGFRVQLNFSEIDIESHGTCSFDSLSIYNGPDETAPLLGRYCDRHAASTLTSSSNEVLIVFKSDISNTGRGFRANYNSISGGCGGVLTFRNGYIYSPNYPNNYPTNTQCQWTIIVQQGHNVQINFTDFDMESHSSCRYDYLQIIDGYGVNATELARGCGTTSPGFIQSTGNVMIIKFRSDASLTRRGFKGYYKTGCGGTVNADIAGFITSPNFPRNYPHNTQCVWVLRGTPGKKVTLTFTNMDIEAHSTCIYDYVELRQGDNGNSSLINRYCGTNLPAAVTSFGNSLYVKFLSDSSSSGTGFRAEYTTATAACGGIFTALNGLFSSPMFPASTPRTADCLWKIKVAPGSIISLSFTLFNLQTSSSCSAAYVEVRDGPLATDNLIGRYCGNSIPPTATSTRENMYVRFYHNAATGSTGFKASFAAVCVRTITYTQGYIASPRWPASYPNNRECTWKINLPVGRQISVRFTDFDLEDHGSCNYDFLEARNGLTTTSPLIGRYCGTQMPAAFSSSANTLFLKFKSDYSTVGRGFRLYFDGGAPTTPAPGCGGYFTATDTPQYISTPNYPQNYPLRLTCTWVINAANDHSIKLNFTNFALEFGFFGLCSADYVEVRDGATSAAPSLGRYCGTRSPFTFHSHGSSLYVKFVSDSSIVRTGFRASYQRACGGILRATTGLIKPPKSNALYLPNQNCTWYITVTSGTAVRLTFTQFNLEASNACQNDYVLVRNGHAQDSPILGRYCGSTVPGPVLASNNRVAVQFVTNSAVQASGFLLNYTQYVRGCGGQLSISDPLVVGNVSSPNYPLNYPINTECSWVLNVPAGNTIEFTLVDMDIETAVSCRWDYVELRDGGSLGSNSLGKFCGSSLPSPARFISSGNQLFVKIRSDASVTGRGFTASWKIGCGKTLTSASGTITSPRFPSTYPINRDCGYFVQIPENKRIQLDFNVFSVASAPPQCSQDYVAIYDGTNTSAPLLTKKCGSTIPPSILTSGRNLYLRFVSDSSGVGNGFRAVYRTVGIACGGRLSGTSGTFTTPDYPRAYPRMRVCTWIITARALHSVQLRFSAFNLPSASPCTSNDYVEVRNGNSESDPLIGRYCGSSAPSLLNSTGTMMFVKFVSNSDAVFNSGFSATYTSYLAGCGGNLIGASGNITSPNYPSNYPTLSDCVWILTVPSGRISILFTDFLVEDHSNCAYDFVEIRDGSSRQAPRVGFICGSNGLGYNYTSLGQSLYIRFRSDYSVTSRGFKASWTNAGTGQGQCGGILPVAASGEIVSPSYPSSYPPNLNCIWQIQVPSGYQVSVTYVDTDIEPSSRCVKDYIELQNGVSSTSPSLHKYCARALPGQITYKSSGNSMRVHFKTDGDGTGRGFKLMYNQSLAGCGGVLNAAQGTIISPGYPNGHLHNIECSWVINVPSADRIVLYFNDFNLEQHSRCAYDYLEVRDGSSASSPILQTLCGPSIPSPVKSSGNSLYLRFRTDQNTALRGFNVTYRTDCGGAIASRSGVIESPRYPNAYPPNKDCEWSLQVTPHYRLKMTFTQFSLPAQGLSGCSDYVQVRNGTTSLSPLMGTYCNRGPGAPIEPMSNSMFVKFHSDASANSYTGFSAAFQAVCGGIITDTSGMIRAETKTAGGYHNNEKCTWLIRFPAGQRVSIQFSSFRVEYHPSCSFDYVEIRDGDGVSSPIVGRFCGSIVPPPFISTGNTLNVTFVTDFSVNYDGFSMRYSNAGPACGGDLNSTTGTISSPNYPGRYPHNDVCGWVIRAPLGQKIRITFTAFTLENPTGNVCHDFLEIREGRFPTSHLYGRYCGTRGPGTVTSTGPSLFIRFHTDFSINQTGFTANYQFVAGCGGRLSADSSTKTFTSPNYPNNYAAPAYCEWLITTDQGSQIQLSFSNFQLPSATNGQCNSGYLIVRNGPFRSSPIGNRRYCGSISVPPFISNTNALRIIFNASVAKRGFSASYTKAACGRTYTGNNGMIVSPNYPSFHPINIECVYKITVAAGSKVQLYFREFNIEAHARCAYDYLEIRDGITASSALIGNRTWCGNVLPPSVTSSSNSLYMKFKSDISITTAGFAISYTSTPRGCGGDLNSKFGAVTSPSYPSGYMDTYDCQWKITVTAGKRVYLRFTDFSLPHSASCATTDFVEVRNGGSPSSQLLGKFCSDLIPASRNSTSNQLFIRFKSTLRSVRVRGFRAIFDEVA